jgi:hypothetical protein
MTAILQLPQIDATTFTVVTNADFRDAFLFVADDTVDPPIAIDLTGIAFRAQARRAGALEDEILFEARTDDGTFAADAAQGVLAFAVPRASLANLEAGDAFGDLLAIADGMTINLSKDNGPIRFTIRRGLA